MTDSYRIVGLAGRGAISSLDGEGPSYEPFLVDLEMEAASEPDLALAAQSAAEALAWPAEGLLGRAESVADAVLAVTGVAAVRVTLHRPQVTLGVPVTGVEVTIRRTAEDQVIAPVPVPAAVFAPAAPGPGRQSSASRASEEVDGAAVPVAAPVVPVAAPVLAVAPVPAVAAAAAAAAEASPEPVAPAAVGFGAPPPFPATIAPAPTPPTVAPVPVPWRPVRATAVEASSSESVAALAAAPAEAGLEMSDAEPEPIELEDDSAVGHEPEGGLPQGALEEGALEEVEPAYAVEHLADRESAQVAAPVRRPSADAPLPGYLVLSATDAEAGARLVRTVSALNAVAGVEVGDVSPLARLSTASGDLHSAVVAITTTLGPGALLAAAKETAASHGVTAEVLAIEGMTGEFDGVELPLPGAAASAAVLAPWSQLAPTAVLPGLGGGPVVVLAETAPDRDAVKWLALDWLD